MTNILRLKEQTERSEAIMGAALRPFRPLNPSEIQAPCLLLARPGLVEFRNVDLCSMSWERRWQRIFHCWMKEHKIVREEAEFILQGSLSLWRIYMENYWSTGGAEHGNGTRYKVGKTSSIRKLPWLHFIFLRIEESVRVGLITFQEKGWIHYFNVPTLLNYISRKVIGTLHDWVIFWNKEFENIF